MYITLGCDHCQGFKFYPFCEVVNGHDEEFYLTFCQGKWVEYIIYPHVEKGHEDDITCNYLGGKALIGAYYTFS